MFTYFSTPGATTLPQEFGIPTRVLSTPDGMGIFSNDTAIYIPSSQKTLEYDKNSLGPPVLFFPPDLLVFACAGILNITDGNIYLEAWGSCVDLLPELAVAWGDITNFTIVYPTHQDTETFSIECFDVQVMHPGNVIEENLVCRASIGLADGTIRQRVTDLFGNTFSLTTRGLFVNGVKKPTLPGSIVQITPVPDREGVLAVTSDGKLWWIHSDNTLGHAWVPYQPDSGIAAIEITTSGLVLYLQYSRIPPIPELQTFTYSACPPGSEPTGDSIEPCSPCRPGTFSPDTNSTFGSILPCQLCPAGSFIAFSGALECIPCNPLVSTLCPPGSTVDPDESYVSVRINEFSSYHNPVIVSSTPVDVGQTLTSAVIWTVGLVWILTTATALLLVWWWVYEKLPTSVIDLFLFQSSFFPPKHGFFCAYSVVGMVGFCGLHQ